MKSKLLFVVVMVLVALAFLLLPVTVLADETPPPPPAELLSGEQSAIINLLKNYPNASLWVGIIFLVGPVLGRSVQAVRSGGGLKGIFNGIWLGTNTPKDPPA